MTAIAMTIAGSDSGGGAGIQADLKTFSALGVFGTSAITAITAQNTRAVTAIEGLTPGIVTAQIDAVFSDMPVGAVKIGMLATPDIIHAVAGSVKSRNVPVILDPVMVAKSGDALLHEEAIETLRKELLPLASVLTPNIPEAAMLLGQTNATSDAGLERQGQALLDLGAGAVLMKGGHGKGDICTDILIRRSSPPVRFSAPRVMTKNTHGTGCTLSAAIAAGFANGLDLEAAVASAHEYLRGAILSADRLSIGKGYGPVHHFHALWPSDG